MTSKISQRVILYIYGVSILVTLKMNKQECYAQLNHDYTSIQDPPPPPPGSNPAGQSPLLIPSSRPQTLGHCFNAIYNQYSHFFGPPHLAAICRLLGYQEVAIILKRLLGVIKESVS